MPAKKTVAAVPCDFCGRLGAVADDFGLNVCEPCRSEREIEEVIDRADGVIVAEQVDRLREALARARVLRDQGAAVATEAALQAAWNLANGLFNALESKDTIRTGTKLRTKAAEGNAARSKAAHNLHEEWQRRANTKWAEPQHLSKSARQIAMLIAKGNENPDTIRRAIKPPNKQLS